MVKDGDVWFQILPLQSTKEHMCIIRTLDIGRNKRLAMDVYIDRICKSICWPTNKQAGYQTTRKEFQQ